jgi:hypothetical protein
MPQGGNIPVLLSCCIQMLPVSLTKVQSNTNKLDKTYGLMPSYTDIVSIMSK